MVLLLAATVVLPLFFATLHLVVHSPFMILSRQKNIEDSTGLKRVLATVICFLFSVLNPILLVNAYEGSKEKIRVMAKVKDENIIHQMGKSRKIKEQWAAFVRIELGIKIELDRVSIGTSPTLLKILVYSHS